MGCRPFSFIILFQMFRACNRSRRANNTTSHRTMRKGRLLSYGIILTGLLVNLPSFVLVVGRMGPNGNQFNYILMWSHVALCCFSLLYCLLCLCLFSLSFWFCLSCSRFVIGIMIGLVWMTSKRINAGIKPSRLDGGRQEYIACFFIQKDVNENTYGRKPVTSYKDGGMVCWPFSLVWIRFQ